jgi:lipopolysaccharide assembly protein A
MRYVCIALIVLLTAVVLLFKFQNLTSVSISLLGMVTGGALFGPVRSWILDD